MPEQTHTDTRCCRLSRVVYCCSMCLWMLSILSTLQCVDEYVCRLNNKQHIAWHWQHWRYNYLICFCSFCPFVHRYTHSQSLYLVRDVHASRYKLTRRRYTNRVVSLTRSTCNASPNQKTMWKMRKKKTQTNDAQHFHEMETTMYSVDNSLGWLLWAHRMHLMVFCYNLSFFCFTSMHTHDTHTYKYLDITQLPQHPLSSICLIWISVHMNMTLSATQTHHENGKLVCGSHQ